MDSKFKDRIFGLDLMRSVAIGLVLLLNGDPLVRRNFPDFPRFWFMDGVDLFFVLSGFLIGRILIGTIEYNGFKFSSILHFWKFRWFRTLPNYFLVLLLTFLFVYTRDGHVSQFDWRYLFFLQNLSGPMPDFFSVSWSLVVEEWFYLSFPLVMCLMARVIPGLTARSAVLATTVLFILLPLIFRFVLVLNSVPLSELANVSEYLVYEKELRSVAVLRLDTIAFGVLGAYLSYYHAGVWNRYRWHAFFAALLLYLGLRGFIDDGFVKYTFLFTACSFSLFLLLPLASSIRKGPSSLVWPVTHLSVISYSAYLIHRTLIMDAFRAYGGRPFTDLQAAVYYILYFILTIVLSTLLYRHFELPVMRLRKRSFLLGRKRVSGVPVSKAVQGTVVQVMRHDVRKDPA